MAKVSTAPTTSPPLISGAAAAAPSPGAAGTRLVDPSGLPGPARGVDLFKSSEATRGSNRRCQNDCDPSTRAVTGLVKSDSATASRAIQAAATPQQNAGVPPATPTAVGAGITPPVGFSSLPPSAPDAGVVTAAPPPSPAAVSLGTLHSVANQAPSPSAPVQRPSRPAHEADQLLLFWPDAQAAQRDLRRLEREFGVVPAEKVVLGNLGGVMVQFRNVKRQDLPVIQARMRDTFPAATVNVNSLYYPQEGPRHYFARRMESPSPAGPAAAVGIVDGEVADIPALAQARITRRSFLTGGDRPGSAAHATAIAALIAGRDPAAGFQGVAPEAPLHVAAIMRNDGGHDSTTTMMLAKALDWLIEQRVRVINISLGGPNDPVLAQLFAKLNRLPVAIVAAAGNGGPEAPPAYPAAYPGVLAVTATDAADAIYSRANHGNYIAFAAPGEDVWVPTANGGQYVSGTSYAAALASGAASRLLAMKQEWGGQALLQHVCRHSRVLGPARHNPVFGCGLLQLQTALDALRPTVAASR